MVVFIKKIPNLWFCINFQVLIGGIFLSFQDYIKYHLAEYKVNKLEVLENGVWKRNNKTYPHILPADRPDLNLLETYRKELSKYIQEKRIHLHPYFHHLNSSQAVCFNFFYPLIVENQIQLLLQTLQLENEVPELCEFEKVISNAEGTNFDFYIKLHSGKQIFFEIKYTENSFGKAKPTKKYCKKYEKIYKERLLGKIRADICECEELISNYQLLRNISYVDDTNDNLLIIICPQCNHKLHQEYEYVINEVIEPTLHKNIRIITWEKIVSSLKERLQSSSNAPDRLQEHYTQFKEKYIIKLVRGKSDEKK